MDEKDHAERAEEMFGMDDHRYDDPSEAMKWANHSEEQEDRLRNCYNYVRGFINQLDARITAPEWTDLVVQLNTGCEKHNNMCIGLNPNTLKVYQTAEEQTLVYEGQEYDLDKGIKQLAQKVAGQNGKIVEVTRDDRYRAFYHLRVRDTQE